MRVAWGCDTVVAINEPSFNHHFSPHSPFTNRMTELKLGNDPAGLASSHEFDFHCDDETRLGNNLFQRAGRRPAKRARTLCLDCEATGRITTTYFTNHVEPHKVDAVLEQRAVAAGMQAAPWLGQAAARSDVCLRQLAVADLRLSTPAAIRLTLSLVDPKRSRGYQNLTVEGSGPVA
jgi:hypothetical protein